MNRIGWIIIAVLGLSSQVLAKPPSWVRKPPRDSARTLYAVGLASQAPTLAVGRQEAIASALADLARRVEVEVQTRFEAVRTTLSRQIEDEIRLRSPKAKMTSSLIQEWDFEKEGDGWFTVYVLLALPKEVLERETQRQAEAEIHRALKVDELHRKAEQAAQEGRVREAVRASLTALNAGGNTEETQARLIDLMGRIRLQAIPDTAAVRATLNIGGQDVPARGVPMCFLDVVGEELSHGITDEQGRAEAPPGAVEAQVDVSKMAMGQEDLVQEFSDIRTWIEVPKRNIRVMVQIVEIRGGRVVPQPLMEGQVAAALAAAGFQVVAGGTVDFRILGRCETRLPSERPFNVPVALAEVHLKAIRQERNSVLHVDELGIKGFGNDAEAAEGAAVENAARKVSQRLIEVLSRP